MVGLFLSPPIDRGKIHSVGRLESIICRQNASVYGSNLSLQTGLTDIMLAAFQRDSCCWPELVQITPARPLTQSLLIQVAIYYQLLASFTKKSRKQKLRQPLGQWEHTYRNGRSTLNAMAEVPGKYHCGTYRHECTKMKKKNSVTSEMGLALGYETTGKEDSVY